MADRLHRGAGRGAKWRYTLPETENISTARSASPLVFRSSTPKHDDESNQTSGLDKNNDSQSGGKKRKVSSDSDLIQKKGKEKKKTKWVWSDDKVEEMLKFVREYKLTCDFQDIDKLISSHLTPKCDDVWRVCILMTLERQALPKRKQALRIWAKRKTKVSNLKTMRKRTFVKITGLRLPSILSCPGW